MELSDFRKLQSHYKSTSFTSNYNFPACDCALILFSHLAVGNLLVFHLPLCFDPPNVLPLLSVDEHTLLAGMQVNKPLWVLGGKLSREDDNNKVQSQSLTPTALGSCLLSWPKLLITQVIVTTADTAEHEHHARYCVKHFFLRLYSFKLSSSPARGTSSSQGQGRELFPYLSSISEFLYQHD